MNELVERTRRFVIEHVRPAEAAWLATGGHPDEALRRGLQTLAADAGLLAPLAPTAYGGLGLDLSGGRAVLEEAGTSLLGPLALNCAAPDEGNMHLLHEVGTPEQRERWLAPLVRGEIRSCFAMTEPAPGAGSDPTMLRTRAERVDGGWEITGRKWFITGATGAEVAIVMAATGDQDPGPASGATMFLMPMSTPGIVVEREVPTMDHGFAGGHGEMRFEGVRIADDQVLGEAERGFHYAQVRLGPARLTHCMRWLGLARRSHELALDRALDREAFGGALGDLGMVQQLLADDEIDLAASRALIRQTAEVLDAGGNGKHETSITKTFVAEAVHRIVDRAVQIHGALGVSEDLPLGRYLAEVRPFRIYDGPSEVHRWSIARRALRRREADRAQPQATG